MRTHVEFRSDKFPAYPGEEEKINPGLWGQRLAEFLRDKLKENGVATTGEIGFEDWGCELTLDDTDCPMWIGCGRYQKHDDSYLCFIEPLRTAIRSFPFKPVDANAHVARVADILNKILKTDPGIRDIQWWSKDE